MRHWSGFLKKFLPINVIAPLPWIEFLLISILFILLVGGVAVIFFSMLVNNDFLATVRMGKIASKNNKRYMENHLLTLPSIGLFCHGPFSSPSTRLELSVILTLDGFPPGYAWFSLKTESMKNPFYSKCNSTAFFVLPRTNALRMTLGNSRYPC